MSTKLGVNIDHVATLRNARGGRTPEVLAAAKMAELGGADGVTVHLREDRRHIKDADVALLRAECLLPLNLEMAASKEIVAIACKTLPRMCTIVPERREELTTEGGLDVNGGFEKIKDAVSRLKDAGIEVSLFIDPDLKQVEKSSEAGAKYIELHTGAYAMAGPLGRLAELESLAEAAKAAGEQDLIVNAGHGLNYHNTWDLLSIKGLYELNIGHSIISRAIFTGLTPAVREMKDIIRRAEKG